MNPWHAFIKDGKIELQNIWDSISESWFSRNQRQEALADEMSLMNNKP